MSIVASSLPLSDIANVRTARPDTIFYTRCPVPTASGIAIQQGWLDSEFTPDHIAVVSLRNSSEAAHRESHFTHTLDNSFRQGGNGPALYAASQGAGTVLLGMQMAPQYQGILARRDSGIRELKDLFGRRFAMPRRLNDKIDFWRSIGLQGYLATLQLAGLSERDVEFIDIDIPETYFAEVPESRDGRHVAVPRLLRQQTPEVISLLRGEVDVIFGHSVWGVALREQFGLREIVNLGTCTDPILAANNEQPVTLTVSGELLRRSPDLVDRYVRQLVRAASWAKQNETAARRLLAQELGTHDYWMAEGTTPDIAHRLGFSFDENLFAWLDIRKRFLLQHRFITEDFDLRQWADPGPLQRALQTVGSR